MSTIPDPRQRSRMVNDAITQAFGKKVESDSDRLYAKARETTEFVRFTIKPILQAGGWKDPEALRQTICRLYLEEFCDYSKEELVQLVTMLHLEIMMETIQSNPWANEKPDLLGGQ